MEMTDDLHQKLLALWDDAGQPSGRSLARDVGFSHTMVAEALNGRRIPSREKMQALIEALDGEWSDIEPLYPTWGPSDRRREVRTVVIRDPDNPSIQTQILEELRAIRVLLERRSGGDS
jgi:transcriptional regulator with XRE-family HTH domain